MSQFESPIPGSPVVPEVLEGSHTMRFSCHKGISCWNACCANIDISLTPYDILRLKQQLGISSTEFLREYTVPYELEKDGIAGVKLRPVDNGTACRFMRPEGCSIYSDRPTACRYYPIALLSMRKQDEYSDHDSYALVRESHCLGHDVERAITIDDYRSEQGIPQYDELARGWRQLILKKKSCGPAIGTPSLKSRQLFFMACYDIDTFRAFVASEAFGELFVLPADERQMVLDDDVELMLFAFRFLRQVLFGEQSIGLNDEAAKTRVEKWRARQAVIEQEAAEQRARMEQGMYEEEQAEVLATMGGCHEKK
jgi:uncharacterized protein